MPRPLSSEELATLKEEIRQSIEDKNALQQLRDQLPEYQSKIDAFKLLVAEEVKIHEETPQKRILYADIELLRIDWDELTFNDRLESIQGKIKPLKNAQLSTYLESSDAYAISTQIYDQLDQFRLDMRIETVGTSQFRRIVHAICFAVWIFLVVHVCLFCTPIRILDPILRKRGWKTNELPIDRMHRWFTSSSLYWCGVEVYWEGEENVDTNKAYVQLYTHASSYDAFTLCTGPSPIRLFGKKSLFFIPFLGWLGYVWGHIVINRDNLDSAKKSIDRAVTMLKTTQRTVAIAPEGTRSRVGRPIGFKKGAFHFCIQSQLPIQPVILMNPGMFWGGSQYTPAPGRIYARVLPEITIQPNENYKQLRDRVHRIMLEGYKTPIGKTIPRNSDLLNFLSLPLCFFFTKWFYGTVFGLIGQLFA